MAVAGFSLNLTWMSELKPIVECAGSRGKGDETKMWKMVKIDLYQRLYGIIQFIKFRESLQCKSSSHQDSVAKHIYIIT